MAVTIEVDEQLKSRIDSFVEQGIHASALDVLREAVALLQDEVDRIREGVLRGIADADAGRLRDADEVFDELEEEFRALAAKRAA